MERKFLGTRVPGNESTRERKFHMELSLLRAKVRGNESSSYPQSEPSCYRIPVILNRYRHLIDLPLLQFRNNNKCSILLTQKRRTVQCNRGATTRRM